MYGSFSALPFAIHDAVMDAQRFARAADKTLDKIVRRFDRRRENHDVPVARVAEPILELVDQEHVVDFAASVPSNPME